MLIDWNHFTPWASLIGGLLLGLSAILMMLLKGRILGISGILGGLLPPRPGDRAWRLAFLAGMACAPWLWKLLAVAPLAAPRMVSSVPLLLAAGLLADTLAAENLAAAFGQSIAVDSVDGRYFARRARTRAAHRRRSP